MTEPVLFLDGKVQLHAGDCRDRIRELADNSIDAVVTDPPYALVSIGKRFGKEGAAPCKVPEGKSGAYARASAGFMGKQWDTGETAFAAEFWADVLRVLKPGGHVVAFSGTRTYHRMACAIEDAGFEIRDQLAWTYGSGFPKSHDVSKGIDKARDDRAANSAAAKQWSGWGTALKPAFEPVCFAQKPLTPQQFLATLVPTIGRLICEVVSSEKTDTHLSGPLRTSGFLSIATSLNNCLAALSGSESRFTTETAIALTTDLRTLKFSLSRLTPGTITQDQTRANGAESDASLAAAISRSVLAKCERLASTTAGEIVIDWLASEGSGPEGAKLTPLWEPICLARKPLIGTVAENVLEHGTGAINIDGCRVPSDLTEMQGRSGKPTENKIYGEGIGRNQVGIWEPSQTGRWPANVLHDGSDEVLAAFPDAPGQQRAVGPEHGPKPSVNTFGDFGARDDFAPRLDSGSAARFFYCAKADADDRLASKHPTVKPVALMQWLVRLVTPKGGLVLDPFAGTGTTGEAAFREGMRAVLIEREEEYQADIKRRMELVLAGPEEKKARLTPQAKPEDLPLFGGEAA